jgi:hypothetical protein
VKRRRLQIVEILWDDITGHGPNWMSVDDIAEKCTHAKCRTVGYLWSTGAVLKVVGTFIPNDRTCSDVTVIPVGVVRKQTVLATVTVEFADPTLA